MDADKVNIITMIMCYFSCCIVIAILFDMNKPA